MDKVLYTQTTWHHPKRLTANTGFRHRKKNVQLHFTAASQLIDIGLNKQFAYMYSTDNYSSCVPSD
jgi:hypothetical protein